MWEKCLSKCLIEEIKLINPKLIIFQGWSNVRRTLVPIEDEGFELVEWIAWDRIKGRGAKKRLA